MKKEYVGIHLGRDFMSVAKIEGKSLTAFTKLNLSPLKEESNKGVIQEDVLWEALINKGLREIGVEHSEVYVSLEDREFIFRSFDMPLISRKEIESSMSYEVEKYIPFKMEELIWDYGYAKAYKYKKINLSFIGMKITSYKRYKSLFANTDVSVLNIEPLAISLARVIKSLKVVRKVKNFVILDFSEGKPCITFFYNDLPVFNKLLGTFEKDDDETIIDKLAEEVRVSVQYFRREFKNYDLNNLFILCDSNKAGILSLLKDKIDIKLEVITAEDILHVEGVELEHLKAYATAAVSLLPFRFSPKFQSKDDALALRGKVAANVPSLNYILLGGSLIIGVVACVFLYYILNNKLAIEKHKINQRIKNMALTNTMKGKSVEDIKQYIESRIKDGNIRIDKLKDDFPEYEPLHPILETFPEVLSKGMWLSDFDLRRDDKGNLKLRISGYVLLIDNGRGKTSIDEFITSFRKNKILSRYFRNIDLVSMGRSKVKGYDAIEFSLNIE